MGGLTVLAALNSALPNEDFLYLGDTARLPYGTKSPATVRSYASRAAQRLVDEGVKGLVVACNTASGIALDHLAQQFAPLPVFGVVGPGARAAAAVADPSGVMVLATESTVAGGAYQRALLKIRPDLRIRARACPLWVTLAEQGPVDAALSGQILTHSVRDMTATGPTTLLLGCTHFPVFRGELQALLPGHYIVDSAETTAVAVREGLSEAKLCRADKGGVGNRFLATDGVARFARVGAHFLGQPIHDVDLVDL